VAKILNFNRLNRGRRQVATADGASIRSKILHSHSGGERLRCSQKENDHGEHSKDCDGDSDRRRLSRSATAMAVPQPQTSLAGVPDCPGRVAERQWR
jgi:hypothetical protein